MAARLTARKKWFGTSRDIQVGEVVLVLSPDTSRGNWPLGRVIEVFPGQDGHVRVVKIQVGRTTLVLPISKLCPLECDVPVKKNYILTVYQIILKLMADNIILKSNQYF